MFFFSYEVRELNKVFDCWTALSKMFSYTKGQKIKMWNFQNNCLKNVCAHIWY